jgi:hypothetical protein
MRRILFALGCTIATVMAGEMGICQKNCGIDFGKCLITTGDFKSCLKSEAACSLDCLKSKNVKSAIKVSEIPCETNCGLTFALCYSNSGLWEGCDEIRLKCISACPKIKSLSKAIKVSKD